MVEAYDGFPQHENGIGMARAFEAAFHGDVSAAHGVEPGFFSWVDGAPAAGYRAPRSDRTRPPWRAQAMSTGRAPVGVLTGEYGAAVLAPLVGALPHVRLVPVHNAFFGGNIAVTGLMTGVDIAEVLRKEPEGQRYLLPDVCLSEGRFLDGTTVADLPRAGGGHPQRRVLAPSRAGRRRLGEHRTSAGSASSEPRRRQFRGGTVNAATPTRTPGRTATPDTTGTAQRPLVVIAGRPNVGKSTLVNRFVGRRAAVVQEKPGVTRDRLELDCEWNGRAFVVVDTGGWLGRGDALDAKVTEQAERAVAAADLVLLVVDAAVGITTEDDDVARLLSRSGRPVCSSPTKWTTTGAKQTPGSSCRWGWAIPGWSAPCTAGGPGTSSTRWCGGCPKNHLRPAIATAGAGDGDRDGAEVAGRDDGPVAVRVAIVGRPNVGKSTLFNRMLGEERSVVHDLPGTTRDAIDTQVETAEGPIRFIDTAGMRRRSRTEEGTEYYAMVRALQALDHADVVLLVIDATDGVTHQDQRLAERIGASGSPVVVILNKWELLDTEGRRDVVDAVEDRLAFLGESPTVKVSARSGMGVHKILPALGRPWRPTTTASRRGSSTGPSGPSRARMLLPGRGSGTPCKGPSTPRRSRSSPPGGCRRLPALRGAQAPRAIRDRADPHQDPGSDRARARGWVSAEHAVVRHVRPDGRGRPAHRRRRLPRVRRAVRHAQGPVALQAHDRGHVHLPGLAGLSGHRLARPSRLSQNA